MPTGLSVHRAGALDLRPLAWLCVLALALGLLLVSLAVLWPPDRERSVVAGEVIAGNGPTTTTSLSFRNGRWSGDVDAFASGSITHFRPREHPGFFLVRFNDGSFRAMADRSPHKGQRLEWRQVNYGSAPDMRGTSWRFFDGDSTFLPDGFAASGPAPRPLDLFPLTVEDGRLYVAPYALCPAASRQSWCARSPSAEAPLERCSEISGVCWSPQRCPLVVGFNTYYCMFP